MEEKKTVKKTAEVKDAVKKPVAKKTAKEKTAAPKADAVKKVAVKKTTLKEEAVSAVMDEKPAAKRASKKAEKSASTTESNKKVAIENPEALSQWIAKLIDEKKGLNIVTININAKSVIADYFVIASATSTTAVRAITDYVDEKLSKDFGIEPLRRDLDAKWTAVDYGSVIVHIFFEETREFYQLERLWSDGTNLTVYKGKN